MGIHTELLYVVECDTCQDQLNVREDTYSWEHYEDARAEAESHNWVVDTRKGQEVHVYCPECARCDFCPPDTERRYNDWMQFDETIQRTYCYEHEGTAKKDYAERRLI